MKNADGSNEQIEPLVTREDPDRSIRVIRVVGHGERGWLKWAYWMMLPFVGGSGLSSAAIFQLPAGFVEVASFTVPHVQTWGGRDDAQYKERVLQAAALSPDIVEQFQWFVFCIRCIIGERRGKYRRQVPDVENIPKLIVDAFTGLLYPDDNLHYVRGVQVEAEWSTDAQEQISVWIFGMPKPMGAAAGTSAE